MIAKVRNAFQIIEKSVSSLVEILVYGT